MPTPIYDMAEMVQAQANPHVIFNEAIRKLEVIAGKVAGSFQDAPPGSPDEGDVVVVGTGSGGFAGRDDQVAYFSGGQWRFIQTQGGEIWSIGGDVYQYDTVLGWEEAALGGGGAGLQQRIIDSGDLTMGVYSVLAVDEGRMLVVIEDAAEVFVQAPGDETYPDGFFSVVINATGGEITLQIDGNNTDTINGSGSAGIPSGQGVLILKYQNSAGTDFWVFVPWQTPVEEPL